jgi:cell division protein FtsL
MKTKRGYIDQKVFEEYQENEKQKNICLHKFIIGLITLINIVFLIFICFYKYQLSQVKNEIISLNSSINDVQSETKKIHSNSEKMLVSLFSNIDRNHLLLSDLIHSSEEFELIMKWINFGESITSLCYQSSFFEDESYYFKENCLYRNFLVLIQLHNNKRFGAFTSNAPSEIEDIGKTINDPNAFVFDLDNKKKFPIYSQSNGENAFTLLDDGFFAFGEDIVIKEHFYHNKESYSKFPHTYGLDDNAKQNEITDGESALTITNLEIYNILKIYD